MMPRKVLLVLLVLLITISTAVAADSGSLDCKCNYTENNDGTITIKCLCDEPSQLTSGVPEYTTITLCRDNICSVGGTGRVLQIINNDQATNPTYKQLLEFLKADKTDERKYTSNYVCADYAVDVHNAAEKAGIRAGWIGVYGCDHAFNIFETTDKGTVYIDCTGMKSGGKLLDAEMKVVKGETLTGKYLFRTGTVNMGCTVEDLLVFW